MAKTRGFQFSLVLWIAVLPACVSTAPGAPGRGDSHSLHYDFNISSVEPRCMVQVTIDEQKYLLYDCGINKVISMNVPREAGKAIPSCKGELDTLSNMGNKLKPLLADIKQENYSYGAAPLTLQVRMTCHGSIHRSLEFSLRGQRLLTFHSETEEYKADNSEGERLKKKWKNYGDLNKHFQMTLKGDCNKLHQCWVHRTTELETTAAPTTVPGPATATPTIASASPTTVPAPATATPTIASASPTTVPAPATTTPTIDSASPTKTTVGLETWLIILIVLVIFIILTIICIIGYIYRKRLKMLLKSFRKFTLVLGCISTSSSEPVGSQELQSLEQMQRLAGGCEDSADVEGQMGRHLDIL